MKFCVALFLLSIVGSSLAIGIGFKQSVGAKGKLLCNGKPAGKITVKLYDDDRGLDTDDHMGTTKSDSDGHFEVSGSEDEITDIDPKLNIYHDCDDGLTPCQRKLSVMIPDGYITKGKRPEKYYDAGEIELAGKLKGEDRDCIH